MHGIGYEELKKFLEENYNVEVVDCTPKRKEVTPKKSKKAARGRTSQKKATKTIRKTENKI